MVWRFLSKRSPRWLAARHEVLEGSQADSIDFHMSNGVRRRAMTRVPNT